jgi:hypothetical protein
LHIRDSRRDERALYREQVDLCDHSAAGLCILLPQPIQRFFRTYAKSVPTKRESTINNIRRVVVMEEYSEKSFPHHNSTDAARKKR